MLEGFDMLSKHITPFDILHPQVSSLFRFSTRVHWYEMECSFTWQGYGGRVDGWTPSVKV